MENEVHSYGSPITYPHKDLNRPSKDPPKKSYAVPQPTLDALNAVPVWDKAIAHLREEGKLQGSPADIGLLMKEICLDFEGTNKRDLEEALYTCFRKQILRYVSAGFPEYYKERLANDVLG